ncbi:redoxin domain-containing protein [bacterium]|nr:redoxin domain-containing protein [bacterium]
MKILIALLITMFAFEVSFASNAEQLIGTPAPEWNNQQWLNSPPLRISDLKGKVILVRFFMDSSCPLCRASAPYLNDWFTTFKDKGLMVIGMYTPKPSPMHVPIEDVEKYVKEYGFEFPVALDNDWATLNKFWLDRVPDADFTSVSFLIDKKGIVRYIHEGGQYDADDVKKIREKIEKLLISIE